MLDYLIFAATFVVVLVISVIYLYPGSKKVTTVPGPEPVDPIEGNYPDISASGSLHEFLAKVHSVYGEVASFWAGPQLCISVASPTYFEQLTGYFDRPESLFRAAALLWGESSSFLLNGSAGRKTHDQLNKRFDGRFVDLSLKENKNLIQDNVEAWTEWPKDQFFPLHEQTSLIALKFLVRSLLGTNLLGGGEDGFEEEFVDLKNNLDHAWAEVDHCIIDTQDVDGRREDRLNKYKENIEQFINKAAKKAEIGAKKDDDDVTKGVEQLLPIICDGYFKLSSLLTWFGYFVAMDDDVQTRLRKEMGKVDLENVVLDDFNNLRFLQAVIKETLRCGNIVPYTARVQNFETVFGAHKIPAGTPILQALGVVNGDENVFEEAESFNPDRFLSKDKPPPFACHPFGFAGNRKCPWAQMSVAFLALFYSYFLRNFELKLASDDPICSHYGFYVKPKEEVWLSLKHVSS